MFALQSSRDIIDLVTLEKIPIVGFMFLTIVALAWMYMKLQKKHDTALEKHKKEVSDIHSYYIDLMKATNEKHAKEAKEMNERVMQELRNSAEAYKNQSKALQMIIDGRTG